jgi:AraC-like DNA-binding protein
MIESDMQIREIAFKVGFNDQKHFREQFQKLFEMNPSAFVKKYKNSFVNNRTANRVGQIIRK